MDTASPSVCTVERLPGCESLRAGFARLEARVRGIENGAVDQSIAAGGGPECRLRRIEVEVEAVDPLAWLAAQPEGRRSYFRSLGQEIEVAMVGRVLVTDALDDPRVCEILAASADSVGQGCDPFLLTTCAFDAASLGDGWEAFGAERISLCAVELRRMGARALLAVHLLGDSETLLRSIRSLSDKQSGATGVLVVGDEGDLAGWTEAVEGALADIATAKLSKVVLARTKAYLAAERLDPFELLLRLRQEEPNAYHICVEESPGRAFVSVSPECLFRRTGLDIESPAIAGTCGRGSSPDADRRLSERLMASDKNRREHEFVVRHILGALTPLCSSVSASAEPEILRLPHVQHLQSTVRGQLASGCDDRAILRRLHPTPAVCGEPARTAADFILANEGVSRGHYAGVVGVLSSGRSDCAVGIRSALVEGARVVAYAGAGIVRGSDADAEWLETARKLESFDGLTRAT